MGQPGLQHVRGLRIFNPRRRPGGLHGECGLCRTNCHRRHPSGRRMETPPSGREDQKVPCIDYTSSPVLLGRAGASRSLSSSLFSGPPRPLHGCRLMGGDPTPKADRRDESPNASDFQSVLSIGGPRRRQHARGQVPGLHLQRCQG